MSKNIGRPGSLQKSKFHPSQNEYRTANLHHRKCLSRRETFLAAGPWSNIKRKGNFDARISILIVAKKLISAKQLRTKETKRRVTGSTSDSKEQEPSNDMKRPKLNRIKTFERTEPTLDDVQKPARPELRLVQTLEMTKDHHRHSRTKMTNWKHQEQRGPERRMSNQIYREASFELMQR